MSTTGEKVTVELTLDQLRDIKNTLGYALKYFQGIDLAETVRTGGGQEGPYSSLTKRVERAFTTASKICAKTSLDLNREDELKRMAAIKEIIEKAAREKDLIDEPKEE